VVPDAFGEAFVSQHLALIRPKPSLIDSDWLAVTIFSTDAQQQMDAARYGGTKTQLALDDIGDVRIPLPTLEDQRRNVERFRIALRGNTKIQRAIQKQVALIRERREALISLAVTGRLSAA
ncbi:MAG: restriction endonuclease subunit S, partial [bacterium]